MKYFTFILLIISLINFNLLFAKNPNLKKLKEIEERLFNNEETYLELLKIEKEIKKNINKTKNNVKKYKKLIRKGFSDKSFLEQSIINKRESLQNILEKKKSLKNNQNLLLNSIVIAKYDKSFTDKKDIILRIIYKQNSHLLNLNNKKYINLKDNLAKYEKSLNKLNSSLNNIEIALSNRSNDLEGLIGETIITEIEKQENIIKKNKIKKKVNKIKSLIENYKNTKEEIQLFGDFKFKALKDILPVTELNIKEIKTAKLKTGIRLSVINNTNLIAPKNSLVVYADFF